MRSQSTVGPSRNSYRQEAHVSPFTCTRAAGISWPLFMGLQQHYFRLPVEWAWSRTALTGLASVCFLPGPASRPLGSQVRLTKLPSTLLTMRRRRKEDSPV